MHTKIANDEEQGLSENTNKQTKHKKKTRVRLSGLLQAIYICRPPRRHVRHRRLIGVNSGPIEDIRVWPAVLRNADKYEWRGQGGAQDTKLTAFAISHVASGLVNFCASVLGAVGSAIKLV